MQFRTYINIKPSLLKIDHSQSIFSLGSCFAENIAAQLKQAKFRVVSSPTGILFNPESIARTIAHFVNADNAETTSKMVRDGLQKSDIDGRWFSYNFHSSFSDSDADIAANKMATAYTIGHKALVDADTVIITFGTAWIYRHRQSGQVVANCHKQPHNIFSRELLSPEHIAELYEPLLSNGILSNKRIIFTVSPIRHLADGLEDNSLSKSILRVAIGNLVERFKNVEYFPSFEIQNDELRDYRFYAEDMIHPSHMAVEYIWQRFSEYIFNETTRQLIEQLEGISKAAEHRPFDPYSEVHKKFCTQQIGQIERINELYPAIDFSKEKEAFCRYL